MQVLAGAALSALMLVAATGACTCSASVDDTPRRGVHAGAAEPSRPARPPRATEAPQTRPHGERVAVPPDRIRVNDGDTFTIRWPEGSETVRVLGIDAPETIHLQHEIPYGQPFGAEARSFAEGVLAGAARVEILRAATLDRYGRTLGYVFLGGRNYSLLIVQARLAEEDVSHFGDNGFPREAAEVQAAAREAGPLAFESPATYRSRMRELSRWLKSRGRYPD